MKLLASVLVLSLIGITPAFAEDEMYPLIRVSEVNVNVNDFRETNNVIVNLLFNEDDILSVTEDKWYEARFGIIIDYDNFDGDEIFINMNNAVLTPLENVQINRSYGGSDRLEDHQTFDFQFSNIKEIFPEGTKSKSISFELSSSEIKFGMGVDDIYNVKIVEYGLDADYTTFDLNDSKLIEPETTQTPASMEMPSSIEEQMKLQEQQAIEQAKLLQEQRELEQQQEMELQKEQERITAELELQQEQKRLEEEEQVTSEMVPEPVEEKKCGAGTELKNGYCQVITDNMVNNESSEPTQEQKGFFEWLMSLFGM